MPKLGYVVVATENWQILIIKFEPTANFNAFLTLIFVSLHKFGQTYFLAKVLVSFFE